MDIITILKDFFRCKGDMQKFINHRFNDDAILRVYKDKFFKNIEYLITSDGLKFKNTVLIHNLLENAYRYDKLLKDDIVLVLGACEGDCLVFADRVKHIIAVEPLHYENLYENIANNNIKNIDVIVAGIGEGKTELEYEGKKREVELLSLTEIVVRSGLRPNVLICDIQGYEHFITKEEFKQFRMIEMETHFLNKFTLKDMREKLNDAGFEYYITDRYDTCEIIHATRRAG